jgi:ankyrin repeat protein
VASLTLLKVISAFDVSAYAIRGLTPLHIAASRGDEDVVRHLLALGASIYGVDKRGRTAEGLAEEEGRTCVFHLLRETRLDAPGQLVYSLADASKKSYIWIGDHVSTASSIYLTYCDWTLFLIFGEICSQH